MFETDRLLYIDLHKTGCSHIRRVLAATVGGKRVGKHNRPEVFPSDRTIVGSVRNPWDWYVSLWAFGCKGEGAIHGRTTRRFEAWYYGGGLAREMAAPAWQAGPAVTTLLRDVTKPVGAWREVYTDPRDPALFRRWLRLVFDPERRFDLGEGFAFASLSRAAGLLTYRYLKLFSRDLAPLFRPDGPATYEALRAFDAEQNALDFVIRTENLEADLVEALARAGYELDAEQTARILDSRGHKTNTSEHRESEYYYDDETVELVRERERLIVEKHGYPGPGAANASC